MRFEELCTEYEVMTIMWLLVLQTGRHTHSDLDKDTFGDFLDELISDKHFSLHKAVAGKQIIVPRWDHSLNDKPE